MGKMIPWLAGLALCALASACMADPPSPSAEPAGVHPDLFRLVQDMPCQKVRADVRGSLRKDPQLGLTGEDKLPKGIAFRLPPREEKNRKWRAVVRVECFGPLSTRVSVLVDAEKRGADGVWRLDRNPTDIEKTILDKLGL